MHLCNRCWNEVDEDWYGKRKAYGLSLVCPKCADAVAKARKFTVVPMHKGNYMLITNQEDLIGINNKGGLVK